MKIPFVGLNISLTRDTSARTAAETRVKRGLEIGDSGTQILGGIITEEYNSKLQDTRGIDVYEEMRKSDGTVKAALLALTLPIRRANWYVNPASTDQADMDVATFVEECFFEYMEMAFDDLIRQALLMLPFGVMVFEKVFSTREIDGKTMFVWQKFAPRLPKSIYKWETAAGEPGIQQRKQKGDLVDIPMEKLVVLVNEKEGDNWWGTSVLRAAYKHWYIKNNFYKIDAIAFERQGLGIPYAKLPENYTEEDRSKVEDMLKNMRAHDQAFAIIPHDYEVGFMDMQADKTRDPSASIGHHNREIAKSVLAHFLELGATDSGSRALSEDQSGLFLHALEAVANNIADVFNKDAVKQLVDLNFDVTSYPTLAYNGITRTDVQKIATAYQTLVNAGGVQSTEQDEVFFRELLGLPERVEGDDAAEENEDPEEPTEDDAMEEAGLAAASERVKKKEYPTRTEIAALITASTAQLTAVERAGKLAHALVHIAAIGPGNEHRAFFREVKLELRSQIRKARIQLYAEDEPFKGYRALTFAEKKVDFKAIQRMLDQLEGEMDAATQDLLHAEREKYIRTITKAALAGDSKAIKDAQIKARASYSGIIKDFMKRAYEYGKTNAALEMKVKAPPNDKRIIDAIDIQADAIAQQHIAEISNEATSKYAQALDKGESATVALAAADNAAKALIDELTSDTSAIAMAGSVNRGRDTTFTAHGDKIYALQRSEILDTRTCNYCLSIDGRIIEKTDPFGKNTIFHSGCRGIWVEIMQDEEELPTIGGIPKTLRDRFGDAVNDLIQPRTPQTRKDSLARKEAERRAKRKKQ